MDDYETIYEAWTLSETTTAAGEVIWGVDESCDVLITNESDA